MLRSAEEFRKSLRDGRVLYCDGERVRDVTTHPYLSIGVDTAAVDYELGEDPTTCDLASVELNGDRVSRFFVEPRSEDDLLRRCELIEAGSRRCFGFPPFAKEGGSDGLHAVSIVARQTDLAYGTDYFARIQRFRDYLQATDLSLALAMTDVKGDRSRRPSEQHDPDFYVHRVARRDGGIVVRGAKAHISSAPYTNEILVVPCRAMREPDRDYAVAFAVAADTPGLKMIARAHGDVVGRRVEHPVSSRANLLEVLLVFDEVFVPEERVFLNGEWQMAGAIAHTFANFHRVTAAAYKYPFAELLVGAAALMAEYNGVSGAGHIRDKIAWLIIYAETIRALTEAACQHSKVDQATGIAYPDPTIGNSAKFYFADNYHQAVKIVQDIAGGILVTAPSDRDFLNEETRPLIEKYLGGPRGISGAKRFQLIKLIKDLVASDLGGWWEVTSLHGEGSLAAQRLAVYLGADMDRYRDAARRAAQIKA